MSTCWFLVSLLSPTLTGAQTDPLSEFDGYVAAGVRAWDVPGLAVTVVKGDEIVFAQGYGVRELGRPDRVDTETLFAIGSTTKAMTAAAIGMLVDEGKLDWDDPVSQYLPEFQLFDPYVSREVTIRDLLTHRAGLGNADFLWYGQDATLSDILYRIRYLEPSYSLRSGFIYQNIMYAAAGQVVATVSGIPWETFVTQRIFEPLGMHGTIPTAAKLSEQPNVALPHFRMRTNNRSRATSIGGSASEVGSVERIENASVDAVAPAGAVWSSVRDMAEWMRLLLRGGETLKGERLLSEETFSELFAPQTMVDAVSFYPTAQLTKPHWTTYGLGWFQQDYRGRAVDFHTGSIDGMVAILGLIREEKLGVFVLGNLDHAELRHALMLRVFDLFDPDPSLAPRDWSTELESFYDELGARAADSGEAEKGERVEGSLPTVELNRFVGTYSDRLYGSVEVTQGENLLYLRYGPGLQGSLEHWHFNTFRVHWDARWRGSSLVSFELDRRARVSRMKLGAMTFARAKVGTKTR